MNIRPLVLILCCAAGPGLVSGCAYKTLYEAATGSGDFFPVATTDVAYDKSNQARMRLYGGFATPASQCYGSNPHTGRNAKRALLSTQMLMTGTASESTSIGMPRPSGKNQRVFDEEVVLANQPVAIRMAHSSRQSDGVTGVARVTTCDPGGVYFVPKQGRDYEASLIMNNNLCFIQVSEVGVDEAGHYYVSHVPVERAFECRG